MRSAKPTASWLHALRMIQSHSFKVTVDEKKPLFATMKEDKKSRIEDVTLAPDLLLPGGQYDLWRQDEERRRVKTIVGAFAERPKLPKMLRRKDLLDTVANGAMQGLFVLSLARPDGSARTWWRTQIDATALADDNLEAVQNSAATLESLDPTLLSPGVLEGLAWDSGVKVADLVAYFNGHTLNIEHPEGADRAARRSALPRGCGLIGCVGRSGSRHHLADERPCVCLG